jgi:hypothetical protein
VPPEASIPFPVQTTRFKLVVQRCGQPEVHLTLLPARKDAALQHLVQQARVLTVHQAHRGTGADYGLVGLFEERGTQLFVFPKSLRRFAGRRIVGIDYGLLDGAAEAKEAADATPGERKAPAARPRPARARASPAPHPEKSPMTMVPAAPAEPPAMPQVLQRIGKISRLLATRKYVLAREEIDQLATEIRAGLEPVRVPRTPR